MRTQLDVDEIDVVHLNSCSLAGLFELAEQWPEVTGVLRLSDGRRYEYVVRKLPD